MFSSCFHDTFLPFFLPFPIQCHLLPGFHREDCGADFICSSTQVLTQAANKKKKSKSFTDTEESLDGYHIIACNMYVYMYINIYIYT